MVCVKQVPDVAEIRIDEIKHTLIRAGVPSILNPFDEFAVEEALKIREKLGGEVTVISMGPLQAKETLSKCLAIGCRPCDSAIRFEVRGSRHLGYFKDARDDDSENWF